MRILVVSDLHIGQKASTSDLCPYPGSEHKDKSLVSSFIDFANQYQKDFGPFNYLIIPGDITHQANLIEYDCGTKFIDRLLTGLSLSKEQIVFVPGNHDVDWSVMEGKTIYDEEKKLRRGHKYNTLNDVNHIFSSLATRELTTAPFFKKWEFPDVVFFGYNSSWHDDCLGNKHFGLIEIEHIEKLREEIRLTDMENKLKIFIVHHHVYQYSNPHSTWTDTSIMQNGQSLIEMLSEYSFNFVIHGHRHVPYFTSTKINSFKTINFLCAGSYSCEVPSEIAGLISNLFHIVEIDDVSKCKGKVLSVAYDPTKGKWQESSLNRGIEFHSAFGNELRYDDILSLCSEQILKLRKGEFIEYSTLQESINDLKYLQNLDRNKLFKDLEDKYLLKKSITSDNEIILIRRNT